MDMKEALNRIASNLDLSTEEMKDVMRIVMKGEATDAQIGAFLMGLRIKSETIDEITGATEVMRELATRVTVNADPLVDIVGTGGDGANLFNVSTAASFVVAAAGGFVAKHGNRAVSSKSGSADLLESWVSTCRWRLRRLHAAWRRSALASCSPRPIMAP